MLLGKTYVQEIIQYRCFGNGRHFSLQRRFQRFYGSLLTTGVKGSKKKKKQLSKFVKLSSEEMGMPDIRRCLAPSRRLHTLFNNS